MDELAMHILDIVYNSIKAKAKLIIIKLKDSVQENVIDIEIIDDGCGMDEEMVKRVVDPFYTTRTTRSVGLGIPLFKEGVEATGGMFSLTSTVNEGTTIHGIYVKDHIDTPRMGDIIETIITLVQGNPDIDYYFEYKKDEFSFVFDTKEIKKILDDVVINEPTIIMWLKEYLKEGLKE